MSKPNKSNGGDLSVQLTTDERFYTLIKVLLESLPFPIFIKDENYRYLMVNSFEAQLFNLTKEEIISKEDAEFVKDKEEIELIKQTSDEAIKRNRESEPNQSFALSNDRSYIFKTYKFILQILLAANLIFSDFPLMLRIQLTLII